MSRKSGVCEALWGFVVLLAALDLLFTWSFEHIMCTCEQNLVAALLYQWGGTQAVTAYKVGWTAFAWTMGHTKTKYSPYVLPVWLTGHLVALLLILVSLGQIFLHR